ncbi:PHD finger protein MALE STERILITY 1 isoform X1 [Beta vulgaris subsp. vulgaris]|uniref:PHD finger protein MALE STERILITY 1 isoform X1 n=1 Tax=Beta vulgaris subsp. vulgaris TaxID=3555 RepID=UPI00203678EB|nr:PHD finger protein MALE STERILITY 1 isoform X1 [Beta vulgaris subsp. vulgaris]
MSQLEYLHSCNKRRKRSSADQRVFRFKSFCEPGYPAQFDGPFWKNVRALLEFGHMESNLSNNGMVSWSFQLEVHRHKPHHRVFLFVIEEPIEGSIYRYCRHCRYIGWGQHMISNMKYHFVVPSKETAAMASTCLSCQGNNCCADGTILAASCGASKSSSLVELEGHTLHGVFHCNGFGHLLCVNGLEMGSDLNGHQIMDFWDRICTTLRARKVSVTDISQKKGMELRLLHGLAYGGPWFSRWDYKFGRGSFGVTESMYQKSIQALQNIPLCLLFHHLSPSDNYLPIIFSRYQALSEHSLITLSDLFHFMLELRSRLPKETVPSELFNPGILLETSCRWSPKRVEMATRVIVESLKRADPKWVSRQEVRDAARAYIGDTGLLDFVLKSLGNHVVGKYLVRRSLNPVTKVLEYCLEDISLSHDHGLMMSESKSNMIPVTRAQLAKDILYLYKSTLREKKPISGQGSTILIASRVILDTKHLTKDFNYHQNLPLGNKFSIGDELVDLFCTLQLKDKQIMEPYEHVKVKGNITIEELKREVEKWFKDMYWGLKGLVIQSIVNVNANETDFVCGVIEEAKDIILEAGFIGDGSRNENGNGSLMQGWNRYELKNYSHNQGYGCIDCACGTKEDDGERMVACDICEVWQHTRCVRIPNNEEVPRIFFCDRCEQDIILSPSLVM